MPPRPSLATKFSLGRQPVLSSAAQLGWFTTGGMTIVRASTDADADANPSSSSNGTKVLTEGEFRP